MLLGYTIMSIVKGNDYANFELLCSIICKIIMLALVKIIPLVIDPSIECDMPSKYCFMLTVLPVISTVVVYNIFLITSRIDRLELIAFSTVSSTLILALNLLVYDIYIKLWGYCKSMKILLISESSTEDDIYCMIDQIIKIDKIIEAHDISEELSYITDIQYDIIIINYDKVRIRHGDFKMIFDIRCKTQAPLLVILEGCEIRDKLHVLNMKADDYIEKPINIDELEEKMLQLLHKLS